VFLVGYAAARMTLEFFREPDRQLGFIIGHYTMGQLLSVPMVIGGLYLIGRALAQKLPPAQTAA
jgi:phosphatidylglycerol:prolipoprotein diacylglycerol transferase